MTPLFSGAVLVALGRSTWAADSIVPEVVTMKTVSTVILMSAKPPPPPPLECGPLIATRLSPLECSVDQTVVVDVLDGADVLNLDREIVIEDNRDDRDAESKRRRNQGFRNTGCDDRETAGAHDCHRLERHEDTNDRAEQPNERRRCARGREHPDVALELEAFLVTALVVELEQMIPIHRLRTRNEGVIDALGGRGARLRGLQRFVELALPQLRNQHVGQLRRLGSDTPQRPYAFENYRQADDRNEEQGIRCIVALLNHRQNTEVALHLLSSRV